MLNSNSPTLCPIKWQTNMDGMVWYGGRPDESLYRKLCEKRNEIRSSHTKGFVSKTFLISWMLGGGRWSVLVCMFVFDSMPTGYFYLMSCADLAAVAPRLWSLFLVWFQLELEVRKHNKIKIQIGFSVGVRSRVPETQKPTDPQTQSSKDPNKQDGRGVVGSRFCLCH